MRKPRTACPLGKLVVAGGVLAAGAMFLVIGPAAADPVAAGPARRVTVVPLPAGERVPAAELHDPRAPAIRAAAPAAVRAARLRLGARGPLQNDLIESQPFELEEFPPPGWQAWDRIARREGRNEDEYTWGRQTCDIDTLEGFDAAAWSNGGGVLGATLVPCQPFLEPVSSRLFFGDIDTTEYLSGLLVTMIFKLDVPSFSSFRACAPIKDDPNGYYWCYSAPQLYTGGWTTYSEPMVFTQAAGLTNAEVVFSYEDLEPSGTRVGAYIDNVDIEGVYVREGAPTITPSITPTRAPTNTPRPTTTLSRPSTNTPRPSATLPPGVPTYTPRPIDRSHDVYLPLAGNRMVDNDWRNPPPRPTSTPNGGTQVPTAVPATATPPPTDTPAPEPTDVGPGCRQRLENGGFESGPGVGWGLRTTGQRTDLSEVIVKDQGAFEGRWMALLGGEPAVTDELHSLTEIGLVDSSRVISASLAYLLNFETEETRDGRVDDTFLPVWHSQDGRTEQMLPARMSEELLSPNSWNVLRFDATEYLVLRGTWTRTHVAFVARNSSAKPSTFKLDRVELTVCLSAQSAARWAGAPEWAAVAAPLPPRWALPRVVPVSAAIGRAARDAVTPSLGGLPGCLTIPLSP
jgi:hypothetical protein